MTVDRAQFNPDSDEDAIEELKRGLYSRQGVSDIRGPRRDGFHRHDAAVPADWGEQDLVLRERPPADPARRLALLKKLFIAAVVFFVLSLGTAGYVFFGGANVVSSSNVDITITGPVSIAGGEILPLEISVTNQNNTPLETADIVIDYPDGTRDAADTKVPLRRYREALGSIPKGGSATKKVQSVLFGEAGETKEVAVAVEYRVKGSGATFSKEKKYTAAISSAPVSVTVTAVKEINANQETELAVDVVSNASVITERLALAVVYPFGFTFKSAVPAPSWSNSLWQLGDLKPGAKRSIKIRGTIAGQDNDDRTFRFVVGTEDPKNENAIGTEFLSTLHKMSIRKPFIGALFAMDGDTAATYIAKPGTSLRADLTLTNNAGVKLTDVKASAKIAGNAFNPASLTVSGGFYRSSDGVVLFDQTLEPRLGVLNPDDAVTLSFSLSARTEDELRALRNPEMSMLVTVTGKRLNESGVSQEVSSSVSKVVRVASPLGVSARALYYSGAFANSGPVPPKADAETTYTIVWALTAGSTDFSGVAMTATLPSYVKWLGVSAPASEKISYNPIGGQVRWDVGELPAGTGFSGSPKQVGFKVAFTPSVAQVGSVPVLVSEAKAEGDDRFTGAKVEVATRGPLTTELSTDVSFKQGQGVVTK